VLIWLTVTFAITRDLPPAGPLARADDRVRTIYNLPVTVMSSGSEARNFKVSPGEVEVMLQGEPKLLQSLQPRDIHVFVDLTGVAPAAGKRKGIEVAMPPGVAQVRIVPPDVQILFPPKN
jgi:YbbR domain-containing protein